MEEQREDLTIIGKPTIQNEDAKFYKDVYVFGKLYYDFDGDDNQFGDLNVPVSYTHLTLPTIIPV